MEALKIIAESWPIAAMVIGVSAAYVVRRSLRQRMQIGHQERLDRAQGNQAVVVRDARNYGNDEG